MSYIDDVLKTENKNFDIVAKRLESESSIRLMHGLVGITSEAGEVADTLKKHIFYGKDLDKANLVEELGDICYYMALICHEVGVDFNTIQEQNTAKLAKRYPGGFTEKLASARLDKQEVE